MKKPAPLRIGLIGCGQRPRTVARHLLADAQAKSLAITALFDPLPAAVELAQREIAPEAKVHPTLESLLADSGVDWVMIGSWNCFHADQVVAALKAGKDIFCEKPLATSLEDCVRLRSALAAAPERKFFFGLVLRYTTIYQKVKSLLEEGVIGRLVSFEFNETIGFNHGGYIHGNWRRDREKAGTHLLEKCCHDFDIVNWLIGSLPVRAASFGGKDFFRPENRPFADKLGQDKNGNRAYSVWPDPQGVDPFSSGATVVDNQVAILEYASGVRATFHTNCNAAILERRLYLLGTEGALRVDVVTGRIEIQRIGFETKPEVIDLSQGGHDHYGGDARMAGHLASTMLEGTPPLATLEDGVRAAVSCFGVDDALDTGSVSDLHPMWEKAGIKP